MGLFSGPAATISRGRHASIVQFQLTVGVAKTHRYFSRSAPAWATWRSRGRSRGLHICSPFRVLSRTWLTWHQRKDAACDQEVIGNNSQHIVRKRILVILKTAGLT